MAQGGYNQIKIETAASAQDSPDTINIPFFTDPNNLSKKPLNLKIPKAMSDWFMKGMTFIASNSPEVVETTLSGLGIGVSPQVMTELRTPGFQARMLEAITGKSAVNPAQPSVNTSTSSKEKPDQVTIPLYTKPNDPNEKPLQINLPASVSNMLMNGLGFIASNPPELVISTLHDVGIHTSANFDAQIRSPGFQQSMLASLSGLTGKAPAGKPSWTAPLPPGPDQ